jgi:hypothetical protein
MMKSIHKIGMVAVIAASVILSSCGKYEDGPKISLASKKARIVNTWKLDKYIENGVDQPLGGWSLEMDIKKDGSYTSTSSFGGASFSGTGTWEFSGDKESLITTYAGSSTANTAQITRLKSNELWTKETNGTDIDEYHYVSK